MPGVEDAPAASSPLSSALNSSASKEDSLAFYKAQYEQLESELADFQTSSRELETELEKDIEAAEQRERTLREKVEGLQFEVDEWKSKCKQSKTEANNAQNSLQKEITELRDTNRGLQLTLRDIEVQNDDFERQARNTTSSLEDLESKYNVAVERSVMLEEEVKSGEKERETLRIEAQRLREELSDLKVEAEIRQDKLRQAEAAALRQPAQALPARPESSLSERSPEDVGTAASSPTAATPPTKSVSSVTSEAPTPPSPPTSDQSAPIVVKTPANPIKTRLSITNSTTPRPLQYSTRPPRHSRGPSQPAHSGLVTPAGQRRITPGSTPGLPSSTSLVQIRGLIGKMQKLEQRVQSARSKLPAPTNTPPRASPRPGSALSNAGAVNHIPANITLRSARKRTSASTSASGREPSEAPIDAQNMRPSSRLSFGMPPPSTQSSQQSTASALNNGIARPSSRASLTTRLSMSQLSGADGLNSGIARPGSRTSSRAGLTSRQSMSHLPSGRASSQAGSRPSSRQSLSGARTPLGGSFAERSAGSAIPGSTSTSSGVPRPRSSIGGHTPAASIAANFDESLEIDAVTPTPSRRSTFGKDAPTAIPMPGQKRSSLTGIAAPVGASSARKVSAGAHGPGDMAPPERRKKLSGVGETF